MVSNKYSDRRQYSLRTITNSKKPRVLLKGNQYKNEDSEKNTSIFVSMIYKKINI